MLNTKVQTLKSEIPILSGKGKIFLPVFFCTVFYLQNVSGQTYCMPQTGTQTVTTCSGDFYDSGCNSGNYGSPENGQLIFCPTISGQFMSITFSSMAFADVNDFLIIYSGVGLSGPLLAMLSYQGTLPTTPIISMDASGCLTAYFVSDAIFNYLGWAATLSCSLTTTTNEIQTTQMVGSYIASDQGNNFLNLNLAAPSYFTLNIFSADGKKVSQKNYFLDAGQHQLALPTQNLPQGIYSCRVTGENINKSFKFIR